MTAIEWTDVTWNPVTGCWKVSPGCAHCYAETMARRQMGPWNGRRFEDVRTHADRLDAPLRWRKPRRVFVNSMSDLFHEAVPDEFIDQVFAAMALARWHTFQVLTKRPARMRAYLSDDALKGRIAEHATCSFDAERPLPRLAEQAADEIVYWTEGESGIQEPFDVRPWPLPNVWLGVSAEDQQRADERVPILLDTPAAVRFVSAEPLLGPIRLLGNGFARNLDWIIVGGESGHGARPCDVAWVRDIVRQCREAGTACFVKQLGALPLVGADSLDGWKVGQLDPADYGHGDKHVRVRLHDRKGGDPSEWPTDLRVRDFPSPQPVSL